MSVSIPVEVPTAHKVKRTLQQAHAKHQQLHRAHHHLARQIAASRHTMIAAGKVPPATQPSGAGAASEGTPLPMGA